MKVVYNLDIMRQTACLVSNPITVYSYEIWFPLPMHNGGSGLRLYDGSDVML